MNIKHLFLCLLTMVALMACSDDDNNQQTAINHVRLSTESATILNEDSQDSIKVNVLLGRTPTEPVTIELTLVGNEDQILSISTPSMTFEAGEKTKDFYIYSNKGSKLSQPRVMELGIKSFSVDHMDQFGENITITVHPDSDIPALTEAQQELLKGYRDQLGWDVERLMGKLSCTVKVIFPKDEVGEEGETVFSKTEIQEYTAETILTLSEKATATQPILKMVDNAMGLTSVFHNILNKEISIKNMVGTSFPSVAKAVGYDEKKEIFGMTLDNIAINEDGTLSFVGKVADIYGDTIQGVPFVYNFSAWERQEKMSKEGATVDIVVNDPITGEVMYSEPEAPMSGLIENGLSFNPNGLMTYSDISEDSWDTGIWKAPTAQLNLTDGKMSFAFPWDHANSSDWTLIEVTYTLHTSK